MNNNDNNTENNSTQDTMESAAEDTPKKNKGSRKGRPFIIIGVAVAALVGASFVPWSTITGGYIKDFNLFSDLFGGSESPVTAEEVIDPELEKALAQGEKEPKIMDASETTPRTPEQIKASTAPRVNGEMVFEDYTVNSQGLAHLRQALTQKDSRPVRIAVIGDSYIEGDILTMDIREQLQDIYGGCGVGYMPAWSHVAGFRTSVKHSSNGWTEHDIRKDAKDKFKSLAGEYFTASVGAKSTYRGTESRKHLDKWYNTRFMFVAPTSGTVIIKTDSGENKFNVTASDSIQTLCVPGATTMAEVTSGINGLQSFGIFLEGKNGILVDNMSLRGNSGITHRNISRDLAAQMRRDVDYDLIIVEYGINALTSKQKDYNGYRKLMEQTISRLKECYPKADIVMMGIGDRGQKINGTVQSIPTSQFMVDAQRDAARNTGIIFWDTREAMGGENAVVAWRDKGMINADYIHLNAKGGAELARLFVNTLKRSL